MVYNPKIEASENDFEQILLKKQNPLQNIELNLESFVKLLSLFKQYKKINTAQIENLLKKLQNNKTFSGDDLYLIKRSFQNFYLFNTKIIEFGNIYQFNDSTIAKTFIAPEKNPSLVTAHLVWLSTNIIVMEYVNEIHKLIYTQNGTMRRIFKSTIGNSKPEGSDQKKLEELITLISEIKSTIENGPFQQKIILVRSIEKDLQKIFVNSPNLLFVLDEIMRNSISSQIAQGQKKFNLPAFGLSDDIVDIFNKLTNILSGFFGNMAGSIQWRKGYMYNDLSTLKHIKKSLRPMDIILEKSPFALTDKFIPGHYGHVALYLGTKSELQNIQMWDHPAIVPYHAEIEAGNSVLEAVRVGVHLNSLENFLNIDEFTVLRKKSPGDFGEKISRGLEQIGKEYDFNFDVSTLDKIVCSELIYIVFGNVQWPTQYRLGRATITPDDVAEILFSKGSDFEMTNYTISTQLRKNEMASVFTMAHNLDYELRAENGDVVRDIKDPTNSFWKKETKCYNVNGKKECKTSYKEYLYEEVGS